MDIKLIDLKIEDLELVREWRNSPEVAKYMYSEKLISQEQQLKWFQSIVDDSSKKVWIIEYDGRKLGLASLTNIDKTLDSCYWAFYLGDLSVRGVGVGSKVEFKVLSYVFEELNLNKLRCEVLSTNENVVSMHEKFSFRREAYYRQHVKKNGKYLDVVGLALLKREWLLTKEVMKNKIYR